MTNTARLNDTGYSVCLIPTGSSIELLFAILLAKKPAE